MIACYQSGYELLRDWLNYFLHTKVTNGGAIPLWRRYNSDT